ncbi:hypothetical protein HanIR_Chr07g0340651 [Helianthus annuus]|nr:hypothetical protein HanIR_Chr07g0340651 [Helianthus annuus]
MTGNELCAFVLKLFVNNKLVTCDYINSIITIVMSQLIYIGSYQRWNNYGTETNKKRHRVIGHTLSCKL